MNFRSSFSVKAIRTNSHSAAAHRKAFEQPRVRTPGSRGERTVQLRSHLDQLVDLCGEVVELGGVAVEFRLVEGQHFNNGLAVDLCNGSVGLLRKPTRGLRAYVHRHITVGLVSCDFALANLTVAVRITDRQLSDSCLQDKVVTASAAL